MGRGRAARYDNGDMQREIRDYDISRAHVVSCVKRHHNVSRTENGAAGLRTSGKELLDLHFRVSSLRGWRPEDIARQFTRAYYENRRYAVKWLFYLRDITEGLGERRSFRICLQYLANSQPQTVEQLMALVPVYGRYDDLLAYLDTPLEEKLGAYLGGQLERDRQAMQAGKSVSLLAKWLPSLNTSSPATRAVAGKICRLLKMGGREYRKTLSALRAYLDVVEVKLSAARWETVDYERVPAKANLLYDAAFSRHDRERRSEYLRRVCAEDGRLNSGGIMPYEIVHKFCGRGGYTALRENLLAELMWRRLLEEGFDSGWGLKDCIVVADGSGSMYTRVPGGGSLTAIEVCHSLAAYFASQLQGLFHDMAVTFSETPQLIDLGGAQTLREKLEILRAYDEVANTDIQAVFRLLLDLAVNRRIPAEHMPGQVLVISDMEFDSAGGFRDAGGKWHGCDGTLFDTIAAEYAAAGYVMPRLIFWNVCGRSNTIPAVSGEQGVCLLSGFSQKAIGAAADREIKDPYQCLIAALNRPRYAPVDEALRRLAARGEYPAKILEKEGRN